MLVLMLVLMAAQVAVVVLIPVVGLLVVLVIHQAHRHLKEVMGERVQLMASVQVAAAVAVVHLLLEVMALVQQEEMVGMVLRPVLAVHL
jgi:hypothetical protein